MNQIILNRISSVLDNVVFQLNGSLTTLNSLLHSITGAQNGLYLAYLAKYSCSGGITNEGGLMRGAKK